MISNSINTVRYFRDPELQYMNEYRYRDPRIVVDLRFDYFITKQITFYVQFRDLFDAPFRYESNGRFYRQDEKADPLIEIGMRGWF